jgi:putative ABC transport system permease protein
MNLNNIAMNSLLRQKVKKLFLLFTLVIGSATIIALFTFIQSQESKIESQFDEYGANILITPKMENLSLSYGGMNFSPVVADIKEIEKTQADNIYQIPNNANLRAVSAKLLGSAVVKDVNEKQQNALVIGIDFAEEQKIKSWWKLDGVVPVEETGAVLGSDVAKRLGVNKNDSIVLNGTKVLITGILSLTGSQDDGVIFVKYSLAEKLFDKPNKVSLIEVSALCSDCPIDDLVKQISDVLPNAEVRGIRQIMEQRMQMLEQFEKFALTLSFVIVVIGGLLISVTVMGAVNERKKEIGIFRAIGFRKVQIMRIILTESLFVSLISGVLGVAVGYLVSITLLPLFSNVDINFITLDYFAAIYVILGVVFISLIATLYPAQRAANVDPVVILHSI